MILREPFITKVKRKKVVNTKYGRIEKITDILFGGWEYAVFDQNDVYVFWYNKL